MFPTVLLMAFVVDTSSPAFFAREMYERDRQMQERVRNLFVPSRYPVDDMTRPVELDNLPRKPGDPPRKKIG